MSRGGGETREGRGWVGRMPEPRFFTREQLDVLANLPSGLTRVSVQEWAVLLRCRADVAVAADELVASLIDWFPIPLSAGEISDLITRLADEGFLAREEAGAAYRTTPLGEEVLEETRQPLMKGALWLLSRNDDEGDSHVTR